MTIWCVVEKHGITLASFVNQIDARLCQQWYKEKYPESWFSVMPRELYEKWEPKKE